jgi:Fe-S cluster assembly ATPase SufC
MQWPREIRGVNLTDNTMAKRNQSRKSDRQYNDQEKSEAVNQTDNTMAKRNQSRKSDRQYNGQEKKDMDKQLYKTLHRKPKME